jgi:hypothetical protein
MESSFLNIKTGDNGFWRGEERAGNLKATCDGFLTLPLSKIS